MKTKKDNMTDVEKRQAFDVTKTEYIVFHKDYIPDINIYYINTLIRRTEMVKYLGLYFANDSKN